MSVVTLSREFGSVGDDFGAELADKLGYHFVNKEFLGELLSQYGVVDFAREYETRPGFWDSISGGAAQRRSEVVTMLNDTVRGLARHGNAVIQGRSGFAILAGFGNVLHVRLWAPLELRTENVRAQEGLTEEEAAAAVKQGDAIRKSFVADFYGVPWDSIQAFDLAINAGKISTESIVYLVAAAAEELDRKPAPGLPTTRTIEVDPILAEAIWRQLDCQMVHD